MNQGNQDQGALEAQLEAAQQEAAENRDKYLRALAETENTRKRMDRLCADRMWQEKKRLLMLFLEVADQLEQALKYAESNDPVAEGVRLTYQQLQNTLRNEGVQELKALGQPFDPEFHEAVDMSGGSSGHYRVTSVFRKGYLLDDRLLRAARVEVKGAD